MPQKKDSPRGTESPAKERCAKRGKSILFGLAGDSCLPFYRNHTACQQQTDKKCHLFLLLHAVFARDTVLADTIIRSQGGKAYLRASLTFLAFPATCFDYLFCLNLPIMTAVFAVIDGLCFASRTFWHIFHLHLSLLPFRITHWTRAFVTMVFVSAVAAIFQ
jgi:hypothetical protein